MVSTCKMVWCLSAWKKYYSPLPSFFFFFLRYYNITNLFLFFWIICACLAWPVKMILPACRKLWCLSSLKNHIYSSPLSWNITKILQTCYFGYFGHACPCPSKAITYSKLWCFSANKKSIWSLNFFKYITL